MRVSSSLSNSTVPREFSSKLRDEYVDIATAMHYVVIQLHRGINSGGPRFRRECPQCIGKKVKVAHTRLPSVRFRS